MTSGGFSACDSDTLLQEIFVALALSGNHALSLGGAERPLLVGMPLQSMLPAVTLPYGQLEVVFNHQNLYASRQYYDPSNRPRVGLNQLDPALLTYDFEDQNAWEPPAGGTSAA